MDKVENILKTLCGAIANFGKANKELMNLIIIGVAILFLWVIVLHILFS